MVGGETHLIDIILGTATAGVVWVWRRLWTRQDAIAREVAEHKLHVAEHYPSKTEVRDGFALVNSKLDKISDKLDGKADK